MNIQQIKKRNGRVVPFDERKISIAILKAFDAAYQPDMTQTAERLALAVSAMLGAEGTALPEVEHVQDLVERILMEEGYPETAKSYILYRGERARARAMGERLMKIYESITYAKTANAKQENTAADTAMGSLLKYGSEGAKAYFQTYVLRPEFAEAHTVGNIHIHDLDFYTFTTATTQLDILRLFHGGFSGTLGNLRKPDGISSYAALCCIALQANQNDQHGSQSIANFDYGMAEGVGKTFAARYLLNLSRALLLEHGILDSESAINSLFAETVKGIDFCPSLAGDAAYLAAERAALMKRYDLAEEEVVRFQSFAHQCAEKETDRATYRAMEALLQNLSTVQTRVGARLPLSALNYGMDVSPEGRMIVKNLLLATEAQPCAMAALPVQIFRVKDGVNCQPDDPSYDLFQLAMRCAAKRQQPGFLFQDAPFNLPYYSPGHPETEIATAGCLARVMGNVHDLDRAISCGRGNLSTTSINLPRLAMEACGDLNGFFAGLDRMMDLCVEQLLERFDIQCHRKARNFPVLMGQGIWLDSNRIEPDDDVREVLRHGTLSVGFLGLAEALVHLTGKHHGQSEDAQALGLSVIKRMRARMDAETQTRKLNFTLLSTPAEDAGSRLAQLDQERYGILPGVTDREGYTSGFQVPTHFPLDALERIRIEAPYHALTNGGHCCRVALDKATALGTAEFEKIIRCMKESGIGYGSVRCAP